MSISQKYWHILTCTFEDHDTGLWLALLWKLKWKSVNFLLPKQLNTLYRTWLYLLLWHGQALKILLGQVLPKNVLSIATVIMNHRWKTCFRLTRFRKKLANIGRTWCGFFEFLRIKIFTRAVDSVSGGHHQGGFKLEAVLSEKALQHPPFKSQLARNKSRFTASLVWTRHPLPIQRSIFHC